MKPFNNCFVIKNNTKQQIKIISMDNESAFFDYILDRLNFDNELTITTGSYEGISSTKEHDNIYVLKNKMLQ